MSKENGDENTKISFALWQPERTILFPFIAFVFQKKKRSFKPALLVRSSDKLIQEIIDVRYELLIHNEVIIDSTKNKQILKEMLDILTDFEKSYPIAELNIENVETFNLNLFLTVLTVNKDTVKLTFENVQLNKLRIKGFSRLI